MVFGLLFFLLALATFSTLVWSGMQLFSRQEDPLGDRLEELQAHAMVAAARTPPEGGGRFRQQLSLRDQPDSRRRRLDRRDREGASAGGYPQSQALAQYAIGQLSSPRCCLAECFTCSAIIR